MKQRKVMQVSYYMHHLLNVLFIVLVIVIFQQSFVSSSQEPSIPYSSVNYGTTSATSFTSKSGFDRLLDVEKCTLKTFTLNCDSLQIVDLPLGIIFPEAVEFADFRNNKIITLAVGSFHSGPKVKALYFANNQISHLDHLVFQNLTSLTHLDLSHNYLIHIPDQAFNGLINLNTIDLGYNKIQFLSKDVFLQDQEGKFFLKELRLNHNELNELEGDLFSLLFHMDALDLEDNVLETLPDTIFQKNMKLRDLKLSMNHFKQVPANALRSARVLEILDLSSNRFREISYNDFAGMITLTRLRISRCLSLEKIREHAFQDLVNLRQLYIEYNRQLRDVHPHAFMSNITGELTLNELTTVSLKGNALTTLSPDTLAWPTIQDIDFSSNPWRCDCNLKWIVNVTLNDRAEEQTMCKQPYKNYNQLIRDMSAVDFSCSFFENDAVIVGAILLFVLAATGLASIGFLVAKLKIFSKLCFGLTRKNRHSTVSKKYIRVDPEKRRSSDGVHIIEYIEWDSRLRVPTSGREQRLQSLNSLKNPIATTVRKEPMTFHARAHSLEILGEGQEVEIFQQRPPNTHRTTRV